MIYGLRHSTNVGLRQDVTYETKRIQTPLR